MLPPHLGTGTIKKKRKYTFTSQKVLNSESECHIHQSPLFCAMEYFQNKQIHEFCNISGPVASVMLKCSFPFQWEH